MNEFLELEQAYQQYSFFLEKNGSLLIKLDDEHGIYYHFFHNICYLLKTLYQDFLNQDSFDEGDMHVFNYTFDYLATCFTFLDEFGLSTLFEKDQHQKITLFLNFFNYYYYIIDYYAAQNLTDKLNAFVDQFQNFVQQIIHQTANKAEISHLAATYKELCYSFNAQDEFVLPLALLDDLADALREERENVENN